jgi:hypothetical protein
MSMVLLTATRNGERQWLCRAATGPKAWATTTEKTAGTRCRGQDRREETWAAVSDVAEEHVATRTYSNEQQYVRETEERQRKENGQPRRPLYGSEKEKTERRDPKAVYGMMTKGLKCRLTSAPEQGSEQDVNRRRRTKRQEDGSSAVISHPM